MIWMRILGVILTIHNCFKVLISIPKLLFKSISHLYSLNLLLCYLSLFANFCQFWWIRI